jgi:hypothetical protein
MSSPPRRKSIDQHAREHGERAINTLADIMDNTAEETKDRIRAAEAILDRGYGKATQAVIAIPAAQRSRQAAALYTNEELDAIIDAEWEAIERRSLPAPEKDPLLE